MVTAGWNYNTASHQVRACTYYLCFTTSHKNCQTFNAGETALQLYRYRVWAHFRKKSGEKNTTDFHNSCTVWPASQYLKLQNDWTTCRLYVTTVTSCKWCLTIGNTVTLDSDNNFTTFLLLRTVPGLWKESVATHLVYLFIRFVHISYRLLIGICHKLKLSTYIQEPLVTARRGCVQREI
jgi:hypothetical protein